MDATQHADIWNPELSRLLLDYNDAVCESDHATAAAFHAMLQYVQWMADAPVALDVEAADNLETSTGVRHMSWPKPQLDNSDISASEWWAIEGVGTFDNKDDACLAWAAPDLLAVARAFVALEAEDGGRRTPSKDAIAMARASIAKAEGRT